MNDEPKDDKREPFGERSTTQWLTVAEVASIEGITPRAVQRRCQGGKYEVRRVEGAKGEVWEINAASTATRANVDREPKDERFGEPFANVREPERTTTEGEKREAELKDEIRFLRGLVEGHQRSEAELRAALREALKAMPKELTTGGNNAVERAPNARTDDPPPDAQTPAKSPVNGPQMPTGAAPVREPRPLWKLILGIR